MLTGQGINISDQAFGMDIGIMAVSAVDWRWVKLATSTPPCRLKVILLTPST